MTEQQCCADGRKRPSEPTQPAQLVRRRAAREVDEHLTQEKAHGEAHDCGKERHGRLRTPQATLVCQAAAEGRLEASDGREAEKAARKHAQVVRTNACVEPDAVVVIPRHMLPTKAATHCAIAAAAAVLATVVHSGAATPRFGVERGLRLPQRLASAG